MNLLSTASVLALGFVLGLKHAVEADHLAAIATMVSERRSLLSSSLVGALWGVGHTISLLLAGMAVILLQLEIGRNTALVLEAGVGIMLIALGASALRKLAGGGHIHLHVHRHGGRAHIHPHIHDGSAEAERETHHGLGLGVRPLLVGMVHGFAGSAALLLLALSTLPSATLQALYLVIFGLGTISGMMVMSALVGLPVYLTAVRFNRANFALRGLAGILTLSIGLFTVYSAGFLGVLP